MAVALRMVRLGRRNRAFFRLRVADTRYAPNGRFLEEVGTVDPIMREEGRQVTLNRERIEYWLSKGAQVSPTVRSLLKKHGIGEARTQEVAGG